MHFNIYSQSHWVSRNVWRRRKAILSPKEKVKIREEEEDKMLTFTWLTVIDFPFFSFPCINFGTFDLGLFLGYSLSLLGLSMETRETVQGSQVISHQKSIQLQCRPSKLTIQHCICVICIFVVVVSLIIVKYILVQKMLTYFTFLFFTTE